MPNESFAWHGSDGQRYLQVTNVHFVAEETFSIFSLWYSLYWFDEILILFMLLFFLILLLYLFIYSLFCLLLQFLLQSRWDAFKLGKYCKINESEIKLVGKHRETPFYDNNRECRKEKDAKMQKDERWSVNRKEELAWRNLDGDEQRNIKNIRRKKGKIYEIANMKNQIW